jgi:phospholipase/carboxylesterase
MVTLSGPSAAPRAGGSPRHLVVLLHGLGADGSDLLGLAPMLADLLPHAAFHAPDAPHPCDMGPYGRQWFSLQDRRPASLLAGVRQAASTINAFLDALLEHHALDDRHLALIGFSQGTMLALHTALRRPRSMAAVLGYSGALIGAETLPTEVSARPPVMLVHGDADDVVPVGALFVALQGLQAADVPVQWLLRPGLPHSIDPVGIDAGSRFLKSLLPP